MLSIGTSLPKASLTGEGVTERGPSLDSRLPVFVTEALATQTTIR